MACQSCKAGQETEDITRDEATCACSGFEDKPVCSCHDGEILREATPAQIQTACGLLIAAMLPTNAAEMTVEQTGFSIRGKVVGDFVITVKKK
jgi:hypothetical protein